MLRGLSVATAAVLLVSAMLPAASAETLADKLRPDGEYGISFDYTVSDDYSVALQEYAQKGYTVATDKIVLEGGSANGAKAVSDEQYENALLWKNDLEEAEWTVNVPASGLYGLTVCWKAADDSTENIIRSIKIDGKSPFSECESIKFNRLWVDDIKDDAKELLVRPRVKQLLSWQETLINDYKRIYEDPLLFYLSEGVHTITLSHISGEMIIGELILSGVEKIPSYAEVSAEYKDEKGTDRILFEAERENILYKNSNVIRMSNTGDPSVSPKKTGFTIMNVVGGTNWQGGDTGITYEIEVEDDGLYELAFRLRQNFRDGLPSYRRIEIDGKAPFSELLSYKIKFGRAWRTETISDEKGNPYLFYLTKGKHTLSITTVQGPFRDILTELDEPVNRISKLTRQIRLLVGQDPDINYDYELETKIPGLLDEINEIAEQMRQMMEHLESISGNKVSMYYQLESMISQLGDMVDDPFIIPRKLTDFDEMLTTLGEWQNSFAMHPLMLDTVEIYPAGEKATESKANVFERIWVGIVQFVYSFARDYDSLSSYLDNSVEVKDTLEVWVGRGTDWAELLKQMADEDFTPETGVVIDMNMLPSSQLSAGNVNALLLAIAAGNTPDVCLSTTLASVGEFALRNALVDLTEFDDFDEVKKRFVDTLFIPMTVNGGVYGLPETMGLSVMAYRKDIMSELGLGIPNTWDELYSKVIPVLSQNNMQFYYAANYNTFLYQYGGRYFTDDLKASALDTPEAYLAFEELCNLYTLYGVPVSANFYNRFRTGEMPIGVVDYLTYMTIRSAAVELQGRWGIAPIPGHMQKDGTIDRSHAGLTGESVVIMAQSDKQKIGWEFLKWWTSAKTQSQYGYEIESLKGEASRWNTANLEAFSMMAWSKEDLSVIESSWKWNNEAPVVLGGYFNTRHVTNAINRVIVSGISPRDSLEEAVKDINAELRRRREG